MDCTVNRTIYYRVPIIIRSREMIIVNYWHDEGFHSLTDACCLILVGVVNDGLDLLNDIELIGSAIENAEGFKPKSEVFYEIHLRRATISSDPAPEAAFVIHDIIELEKEWVGIWEKPILKL